MAIIKPFQGIRPKKGLEEKVASVPYDVLNSVEARIEAKGNPYSFLHIIKPEIDLPETVDVYDASVYEKAKSNFAKALDEGVMVQEGEAALYIYQLKMNEWEQTGIVCCTSVDDYFNDVIKKHELTRPVKEKDRITHMHVTQIHSGPVFSTYPEVDEIDAIVDDIKIQQTPVYDFTASDGVHHTLWVVSNDELLGSLVKLFSEKVPYIYIADGHHRAASSAKVGAQLKEENPNHNGNEEYNFALSVLFPANQLHIIDYNRTVKDIKGYTAEEFIERVGGTFTVEKRGKDPVKPASLHEFGMYLDGNWYHLVAKEGTYDDNDPIEVLDVTILHKHMMEDVLGIVDVRADERIDFVGGIRGMSELEKRVDGGDMKAAFSLYPVTIKQLIDIADSGKVMPPKSTWFEPKLRSGLVVHKF